MRIFFLLFTLFTQYAFAQVTDPFPYKFSSTIYDKIKTDSASWRGGVTSSDLSLIGLYREALEEWDKARPYRNALAGGDSIAFLDLYKPKDAKDFILKKAKESRILIFNEAHHNPRHRVFVTSLLQDLKRLGYNYFAAETFSTRPGFQEASKLPSLNSGYYAMEPQFGNLIREANRLGYALFPYEHRTGGNVNAREIGQAKNLAALLDSLPDSKLIVYCGFDHAVEDSIAGWGVPMAARLKEFTGIDPFTIDQTVLSERSDSGLDNPYFRLTKANRYSILADRKNRAFNKRSDNKKVDALLFSPPTTYLHNRPHWVFENGKEPFLLKADSVQVSFPLLAQVYFSEDDVDKLAIPIDNIEIRTMEQMASTALAVFRGRKFVVLLVDTRGKTQVIKP